MDRVINVEKISKRYQRKNKYNGGVIKEDFWALRDISFSVSQGDVVGVLGKNGAGKSTLLKILSRITAPTSGKITMKGRVGCLLEVGTGFHLEMTGRENIYMNGNILGMSNSEVTKKLDDIVEFAGMANFLETPVKYYSSGMHTRLAFSVAAHLEPEILIIDEVLAVGDTEFRKKCLKKTGEIGKSGRTIFFVSHNMDALRNLCTRCIWLHEGHLRMDTQQCDKAIQTYFTEIAPTKLFQYSWHADKHSPTKVVSPIEPLSFFLTNREGEVVNRPILANEEFKLSIHFKCKQEVKNLSIGYYLFNEQHYLIYKSLSTDSNKLDKHNYGVGTHSISCRMTSNILGNGEYYLRLALQADMHDTYYTQENSDIGIFMMVEGSSIRSPVWTQHHTAPISPIEVWFRES